MPIFILNTRTFVSFACIFTVSLPFSSKENKIYFVMVTTNTAEKRKKTHTKTSIDQRMSVAVIPFIDTHPIKYLPM